MRNEILRGGGRLDGPARVRVRRLGVLSLEPRWLRILGGQGLKQLHAPSGVTSSESKEESEVNCEDVFGGFPSGQEKTKWYDGGLLSISSSSDVVLSVEVGGVLLGPDESEVTSAGKPDDVPSFSSSPSV